MNKITSDKKMLNTVKKTVADSVQGVLRDPDYGQDLTDAYQKKIAEISARKNKKTKSLKEIKERYL